MNQYNMKLFFPEINDSLLITIPAASLEDAVAQIHASNGTKMCIEDRCQSVNSRTIFKVYVETIHVSTDKLDKIYACVFGKGDNDEVISETAAFPDGMEMDIKACGEMDDPGWTEAVLFRHGGECGHTDCEEKFEGIWDICDGDVLYVTVVIPESSPWLAPNIITIPGSCLDSTAQVVAHQTNCKGVMGAGVALAIRKRYPEIMPEYTNACKVLGSKILGTCQILRTNDGRYIANLFGQNGFGYGGFGHGRNTDYRALKVALVSLVKHLTINGISAVAMPYKLGCGLAGGDWEVVSKLLINAFAKRNIRLELWKL